jgi:alpha-tubulin suppressor-like RCC1 family protein
MRGSIRVIVAAASVCVALAPVSSAGAEVEHWGSFGAGEQQPVPQAVPGLEHVVAVDASNKDAYVLEANGSVWALGNGEGGELGDGSTASSFTTPVRVSFGAGIDIKSIGEAEAEGAAIDSSGQAWGWGSDVNGSLCLRDEGNLPTPVKLPITDATAVQGGEGHTIWLLSDRTVLGCGANDDGQLGDGRTKNASHPVPVTGLENIVEISAGELDSCARNMAGEVFTWGGNENGQLGDGGTESSDVPVHVPLPGPASDISCGGNLAANGHSLAIVDGEVYGWGADANGQVGDGQSADKLSPVATGLHYSRVVASGKSSLGLDSSGNVWAWGGGDGGALGIGADKRAVLTPVLVTSGATMISATAEDAISG